MLSSKNFIGHVRKGHRQHGGVGKGEYVLKSFFIALQFLTRIQVVRQDNWRNEDFGCSVAFFPLVGGVLGSLSGGVAYFLFVLLPFWGWYAPEHLATVLLVMLPLILTGGLHADGLMDAADGLLSGRDRDKMLTIMKDSRVGASGVMFFGGLLLMNWSILLDMKKNLLPMALYMAPIIGRLVMTMVIVKFPYARPQGIGRAFAEFSPPWALKAAVATTFFLLLPLGLGAMAVCLLSLLFALWLGRRISRQLGGLTGDTYGAIEILSETFVLLAVSAAYNLEILT